MYCQTRESVGQIKLMTKTIALESHQTVVTKKPMTGKDLVTVLRKTGLIGFWKGHTDIGDSREFARKLRERSQKRLKD